MIKVVREDGKEITIKLVAYDRTETVWEAEIDKVLYKITEDVSALLEEDECDI